ncbi:hypothetical protein [Chryseolinea soli]|uniref:Uncharacterized protein n=1 Tax=Chryseolinea soli TaxID=2321403 RepID=A0A385T0V6_9BACT|nr:hypothetical protein [Chryseolinea soli]AYB34708.1 hypothetical protein D4L85_30815 [Chryseolinea soli]
MTRIYFTLITLSILNSCAGQGPVLEKHESPSGRYTLEIMLGDKANPRDKYGLMFRLIDKEKKQLDYIRTGSSDVMKWAVTWYNDTTIVLDSHDIGSYGWTVNEKGKLISVTSVERPMEDAAVEAFKKKYGKHGLQH